MENNLSLGEQTGLNKESSFFNPIFAKRNMTVYAIPEYELSSISSLNTQSTTFYSVGSGALSVFVTLLTQAIFSDWSTMAAMGKATLILGLPLFSILSTIFFFLGYSASKLKERNIEKIKKESDSNYAPKA